MGAAEDDDHDRGRSETAINEQDDAVDDANNVRRIHAAVCQRTGHLLDSIKRGGNCYAVFCYWLGRPVEGLTREGVKAQRTRDSGPRQQRKEDCGWRTRRVQEIRKGRNSAARQ